MGPYRRWISVAALALGVVLGCVQLRQEADIYPDGSGRILVRAKFKLGVLFSHMTMTEQSVYEEAAASCQGLVAITDAKLEQDGETRATEFVGWFEDANDVRLARGDNEGLSLGWSRKGDAYVLTAEPGDVRRIAGEALEFLERMQALDAAVEGAPPENREQAEEMAESARELARTMWSSMTDGLELETVIRLPGRIASVKGFEKVDERTVRIHVDGKQLDDADRMRELASTEFEVRCDASLVSAEDRKAFAKRLAEVRAEWAENPAGGVVAADEVAKVGAAGVDGLARLLRGGDRLVVLDRSRPSAPAQLASNSGEELGTLPVGALRYDHGHTSPYAKRLHVLEAGEQRIVTVELPSGKVVWRLHEPASADRVYWQMAVASDGNLYVDKGPAGIHLHDGKTGEHLRTVLPDDSMSLLGVAHDPSHVIVSHDGVFRVLDTKDEQQLWYQPATVDGKVELEGKPVRAWKAERIHGGNLLLLSRGKSASEATAHEAKTGKLLWRAQLSSTDVLSHPNARYAMVVTSRGQSRVLDLETGEDLGRITGLPDGAFPIGVDATGGFWMLTKFMKQEARKFRLRLR